MVFSRFRLNALGRVLLLSASLFGFFYLLFQTALYATLLILAAICVYQIYALLHYVEKTNRDLSRFFDAVKHSDFSQSFAGAGLGSSFDELKAAFGEVIAKFQRARADKEEHFRYLQTVVQHVGIGLISFQANGEVELINTAARRLLRVPHLKNIHALESLSRPLVEKLLAMKSGERALVKVEDKNERLQLAIYATEFRMREQRFTLVSLQNIQSELEEKEMEAWQNLIRVLTHEIMNSVTPIASLAATLHEMMSAERAPQTISPAHLETRGDLDEGLQTIRKRSEGLLHFVEAYRNLTRIPKPGFQIFPVKNLFEHVRQLLRAQAEAKAITLSVQIEPESLELTADPDLIEQVLINLLLNAIQAVEQQAEARIALRAFLDERGRVNVQVSDNGPGILPEVLEKIFIPFFTTKQGGSGIGLSLSRQIMRLHRGALSAHSTPGVETVFTLRF
jgi:nitrogen fixation/metabolism regulation signal transduction histidine kinase